MTTARFSTSVTPQGTALTIRGITTRDEVTVRSISLTIAAARSECAITPFSIGWAAVMPKGVLPIILYARSPYS